MLLAQLRGHFCCVLSVESLQHEIRLHCVFSCYPSCFYPTGGPAEGNADQLPVSRGWFCTGFIKTTAELIKGYIPVKGGREREVERTANRGQDPRQEEGIPSPSVQSCLMRSGLREHPCLLFFTAREICYRVSTCTHMWERLLPQLTKGTLERCSYSHSKLLTTAVLIKNCGSKEQRFKNRL